MPSRRLPITGAAPGWRPPRRAVLRLGAATAALVGAAAVAGCQVRVGSPDESTSSDSAGSGDVSPTSAPPVTEQAALSAASGQGQLLRETYDVATRLRPDLRRELGALTADLTVQARALSELGVTRSSAGASTGTTTFPALTATNALSVLGQIERFAAAARIQDLAELDGRTARLMASMAASGAQRVTLLARLPGTPPRRHAHGSARTSPTGTS